MGIQSTSAICAFLFPVIFAVKNSIADLGDLMSIFSAFTILATVVGMGGSSLLTRVLGENREKVGLSGNELIFILVFLNILFFFLILIFILVFGYLYTVPSGFVFLLGHVLFFNIGEIASVYFRSRNEIFLQGFVLSIPNYLKLIVVYFLPEDNFVDLVWVYFEIYGSICFFLSLGLIFYLLFHAVNYVEVKNKPLLENFFSRKKISALYYKLKPYWINNLSYVAYSFSGVPVVGYLVGSEEAGLLALIITFCMCWNFIPGILFQRIFEFELHRIGTRFKSAMRESFKTHIKRVFFYNIGLIILFSFLYWYGVSLGEFDFFVQSSIGFVVVGICFVKTIVQVFATFLSLGKLKKFAALILARCTMIYIITLVGAALVGEMWLLVFALLIGEILIAFEYGRVLARYLNSRYNLVS